MLLVSISGNFPQVRYNPQTFMTAVDQEFSRNLGPTVVGYVKEELEPVRYTGALAKSVTMSLLIGPKVSTLTVEPHAPHTPYIRFGTRPHRPPWAPIERWALAKGIPPGAAYGSIIKYGTSRFAGQLYGTGSVGPIPNPWPERVLQRADFLQALLDSAQRLGAAIAAEIF